MEHFLIAIIPSEDIAIKIRKLRTLIFKKFGIVSSRCLPEIIPVAFTKEIINKDQFKKLTILSEMKSTNFFHTDTNDLFLQINNKDFISSIQKKINTCRPSGFITPEAGIYLGSVENILEIKEIIKFLEKTTALTWKKNSLELLRIETLSDVWWENVKWETIWNQKINI